MKPITICIISLILGVIFISGCTSDDDQARQEKEAQYINTIQAYSLRLSEIFEEQSQDTEAFEEGTLSYDEYYTNVVARQSEIQVFIEEMEELTPPPGFEEIHELILKGLNDIDQAFQYTLKALDSDDPSLLERANEKIEEGISSINEADEKIQALN